MLNEEKCVMNNTELIDAKKQEINEFVKILNGLNDDEMKFDGMETR